MKVGSCGNVRDTFLNFTSTSFFPTLGENCGRKKFLYLDFQGIWQANKTAVSNYRNNAFCPGRMQCAHCLKGMSWYSTDYYLFSITNNANSNHRLHVIDSENWSESYRNISLCQSNRIEIKNIIHFSTLCQARANFDDHLLKQNIQAE